MSTLYFFLSASVSIVVEQSAYATTLRKSTTPSVVFHNTFFCVAPLRTQKLKISALLREVSSQRLFFRQPIVWAGMFTLVTSTMENKLLLSMCVEQKWSEKSICGSRSAGHYMLMVMKVIMQWRRSYLNLLTGVLLKVVPCLTLNRPGTELLLMVSIAQSCDSHCTSLSDWVCHTLTSPNC